MEHIILNNGSDSAALANVALKALREARRSKTSNSGSIFVSDGQTDDDGISLGTGTIINGVDGGIQPWVGDTTPPGKPTGLTASSRNAVITVMWDGTLDGGVPSDFHHITVTGVRSSDSVSMTFGDLSSAGSLSMAELTAGDEWTITAIAYDDAHLADGTSAPNASEVSDALTVTVESAVSADQVQAIKSDLSKAQSDIAAAEASMNDLTTTVSSVDGKATTSGSAPTADDASGKPDGSMWYVMDASGNITGTYILKSGEWMKYAWASSSIADEVNQAISDSASAASTAQDTAVTAQTTANLALANAQEMVINGTGSSLSNTWKNNGVTTDGTVFSRDFPGNEYHVNMLWGALTSVPIKGHIYQVSIDARVTSGTFNNNFQFQVTGSWNGVTCTNVTSDWKTFTSTYTASGNDTAGWILISFVTGSAVTVQMRNLSVKDITAAALAQSAAKAAQDAADAAQTTADGKSKVVRSTNAPSSSTAGYSNGDQWWVYSGNTVPALYLFDGTSWVSQTLTSTVIANLDAGKITSGYVDAARIQAGTIDADKLSANSVTSEKIVADAVTSEKLVSESITADKLAANSVTAVKLAAGSVTADKADIGSLAAAIVTSSKFKTSNGRMLINDDGLTAKDANGNTTVNIPSDGSTPTMIGGLSTASNGKHISISQSGDVGKLSLLNDNTELTSLTFIDDTANSGYVYTGLYTGQNGQFLQFATPVDPMHASDPLQDDASFISNGRMGIEAPYGINVNGTWFARRVDNLPTSPNVVGGAGTRAVVGGVDYVFDGTGLWVSQNHPVTHIDGGNGQVMDWWCIGGVVTIKVTWAHTNAAWAGGSIASIPVSFAPPSRVTAPFSKYNFAQSEGDSELQVNADGSIRWQNMGGAQGNGNMNACVTYHIAIPGTR